MGCETCATQCPAVLFANGTIEAIDVNLAEIAAREQGREQSAAEWGERIATNPANEPFDEMLRRHDAFEGFCKIANDSDSSRAELLQRQRKTLEDKITQRQERCTKGPRDGWFAIGLVGDVVCRSAVQDDGLPNEGKRPSK